MRRTRAVAADPKRGTEETIAALIDLIAQALPTIDEDTVRAELAGMTAVLRYLVGTEELAIEPLTLVAGSLVCDITCVHGEDALSLDEATVPPGARTASDWLLYVPLPDDSPFDKDDLVAAGRHLQRGPAPAALEKAGVAETESVAIDADALRRALGR